MQPLLDLGIEEFPDTAFGRVFAMPSADTLSVLPINDFARRHLKAAKCSVDPFARDCRMAHWRNDLNPQTAAEYHMDAPAFMAMLKERGVTVDAAIFDPPYSPRQIAECYQAIGIEATTKDTQNSRLYREVRDGIDAIMVRGGVVLSFGWNSVGMGKARGYRIAEILMVTHGGAHNDTICMAEIKESA